MNSADIEAIIAQNARTIATVEKVLNAASAGSNPGPAPIPSTREFTMPETNSEQSRLNLIFSGSLASAGAPENFVDSAYQRHRAAGLDGPDLDDRVAQDARDELSRRQAEAKAAEETRRAQILSRPNLGDAEHLRVIGQHYQEQEAARGSNAVGLPTTASPGAFLGDLLSRRYPNR